MRRIVTAAAMLLIILPFLVVSIAIAQDGSAGAHAQEEPPGARVSEDAASTNEGEVAAAIQAPVGGDGCFATITINPSVPLPDDNPNFTCVDMALGAAPSAAIIDVEVVVGVTHSYAGDLIYRVLNPDGDYMTMLHRPGSTGGTFGDSSDLASSWPVTFGDAFGDDAETMGNTIGADQVICQEDGRCTYFPNRHEDLTSLTSFAGMSGAAAAGTWQFCASDNEGGDLGVLETVTLNVDVTCDEPPPPAVCTIGSWQPVADVNIGRSRVGLAYSSVTGKFYLLGGEATAGNRDLPIEEYDPATDVWTDKSHLNVGVSNSGAAAVGAYVYVPGGYDGSGRDDMQRYDPVADVVVNMAPMPSPNFAHAVTAFDDKVYVLGGSANGAAGTTNFFYNVATNIWSVGAALPTAVQYPAAATDGTYIYVVGGNTTNLATVQRYDPVANSWANIANMGTGRGGPGAFFDGVNVWAVGGGWTSYLPSTEYWNGSTWLPGPPMTFGVRSLGAAFGDGIALKAAGWDGTYVTAAETLEIDCIWPQYLPITVRGGTAAPPLNRLR